MPVPEENLILYKYLSITCFCCHMCAAHEKGDLMVCGLWFFKCACTVHYLGYIHAFLSEASSRSLPHVCGQHRLWQDCAYARVFARRLCKKYTLFSCAGPFSVYILNLTLVMLYKLRCHAHISFSANQIT